MEEHSLTCSICLERFKYPVTIPCGHTFCKVCISKHWDQMEQGGSQNTSFNCPICKKTFSPRPTLNRNVSLSVLSEVAGNNAPESAAGTAGRTDRIEDGSEELCSLHQKPLIFYCRSDRMCVCSACSVKECKDHEKVLLEEERSNSEEALKKKSMEIGKCMEHTENNIQVLSENIAEAKVSLQQTSQWVSAKFSQLLKVLTEKQEVTQSFLEQQQAGTVAQAETRLSNLQEKLEQLRELQEQISSLCSLPDCQLIQGAGGNWATVGRRSRGGRRVRRQREKRKGKSVGLRIGTLNVGTMTGKGRELADTMERRKVDILCVQETRWKGSKARSIGAGFKLFYYGVDSKRNGVGVVLKEEFVRNVLEVKRVSDRVMSLKLEIEGVMLNVVSGYAPQVGCELEEKERFWSELDEVMESIPTGERVVIGADFNGHVGEGNTGDEEVMGKFGVKERNLEGQMVVDFAKRMDMGVVNTYFQKREEHRVTYKSGGRSTQVDYILCRRGNLKEISDCKVVVGESVARQHRMVVCRMTLMVCKKKRSEIEKKTKWWKLKKEECCEEFRQKLRQALGGQVVLPDDWETTAEVIRETGRKVLGVSSGRRKEDKETWWWNEEVQDSIQRKRLAKKKWDMDRTEENRQEYKELQRRVKREVSKAKQKAYDELYTRLDTREGEKDLYRLARQRDRDGKDVQQVRVIKDRDGRVLTSEESVQRRWKEYFEELMNEENEREKRVEGVNSVEQKVDKIRKDEVRKALKRMKSGKAVGPDDIPVEVWKCLGEAAVEFLASLFNRVLESERMPEEWRRSVLVPIFKNKGDVQSCSNYRGIKLMSHTMKLWERVVEARLRKVVEICEQQYGFMPRKSTTDAIFALRILMEKYRDGQRELHCVFVDLEKAYDRVPREELWYCMRKSGVAEKYVRVVQDMYERSRTVVRCAVGQTEEFNVEVGLHQGSALSPFLFAIVMDQLSEEVRQESPWTMMFADDIVICSESREQVEENLERWRFALERRGMKVSRSKTEYMCVNEREGSGTVRLQGEEVKKVQEFKYLGSTVQSNGECGKEVKKRVQAGWNGWRKVSGVLCDQKISARIKGKVYRTVVRAAMLYGLETVSLRKRQESELEESRLVEVPQMGSVPVDVTVNLQEKLNPVTDILSRISKLVCEDLDKAVYAAVSHNKEGSPQDKRPMLAVVPSPATPPFPAGKEGLIQYRCSLTFDPRTANAHLMLSQNNQRAEHLSSGPHPVPADEARFDRTWQVLCSENFTHGRHYWELEVSKPWAYVGVTYPGIPRKEKGRTSMLGMNELSWSLQLNERQLTAWHGSHRETVSGELQLNKRPLRIGMLLDYEEGTLAYYGENQVRLHTFHCIFSHELYPACWIGEGVSVTLCPI
ncbi:hypothetical protein QTP86_033815 [Hemibagrus guttatus]|nr:hypothetical protein QTP86_033815 [Hemibagrus guttatus]